MNEFQKIIDAYQHIDFSEKRAALATVVKLYGSSYRRPGARMLMTEDGHWTGAISGGCLEGDALRRSRKAILEGKPTVVTYDTMNDEDAESIGIGLGCNGIIDVLIEPLAADGTSDAMNMLKASQDYRQTAVMATVFKAEGVENVNMGDRLLILPDGQVENGFQHETLKEFVLQDARRAIQMQKSENNAYSLKEGEVEVFIEAINPGIQLMIFGAGYDAIPVSTLAKHVGWHVLVSDDCPAHLAPKRFPAANAIVCIPRDTVKEQVEVNHHSAAVLMSHNFKYDLAVFKQLLQTEIPYIGILGPKKRFVKMQEELAQEGIQLSEADLDRVHSPIGLDLGAETPEEIALSIVSEIQAKFQNRPGTFLKDKKGFIHDREEKAIV